MKILIIICLVFVCGVAYAIDTGGVLDKKIDKIDVDKNKAKEGVGIANEILSDPKARSAGQLDSETTDFLDKSKAGMTSDMKSLAGENDGVISNLKGTVSVNGKIGCIGNDKVASIIFTDDPNSVGMNVSLETGSNTSISNIKGVCSGGFTVCDKNTNDSLCSMSVARTPESSKNNHSCKTFPSDVCRNWQPYVTANKLIFEPLGSTCAVITEVSNEIYNTLIGQVSGALSKAGYPIGKIDHKDNRAVIYSIQSENCLDNSSFGSGLTDMDDLMGLYNTKSVIMPDSSEAMKNAASDNESIYSLIQKGNNIDFDSGATIGQLTFNKCEINNLININIAGKEKIDKFSGTYKFCSDHYINSRVRRIGSLLVVELKGGDGNDPLKGCSSWVGADYAKGNDGWFSVYEVAAPTTLKDARLNYSLLGEGCVSGSGSSSMSGNDDNKLICPGSGVQYPTISWNLELIYSEDTYDASLSTSNGCEVLDANDNCSVVHELVCDNAKKNCIETIKDSKETSNTIDIKCYDILSGVYVFNVCSRGDSFTVSGPIGNTQLQSTKGIGWPNIQREYRCASKPSGMEDASKGLNDIFNILGDGTSSVKLPDSCFIKFCTTTKRYIVDNIYGDGSTNQSIGNSASVSQQVKQCSPVSVQGGLEHKCPLGLDEKIVEDCSCDNKNQLITNLTDVLLGFAMAEELKKYLNCDNGTEKENR